MKKIFAVLLATSSLLFAGDDTNVPTSKQATLVETYSSAEVTIKASGLGKKEKQAVGDLQKAAVYFVMFNGTDPLLNSDGAKLAFESKKETFFDIANITQYITWEADKVISSNKTRLPNGKNGFKITKMVRVNRKAVQDWLVLNKVVKSNSELSAEIGLPFIMVIPDTKKGETPLQVFDSNPLAKHSAATIESFLTARKYDVVVPRAQEQLVDLATVQGELKGAEEDVSYQLALSLGADIYIVYSGSVKDSKASVVVKAFETTTARLLGTETGYSEKRPGAAAEALVEEAINSTINQVLSRLKSYWADDAKKGSQYKVIFKVMDEFDEDELEDLQFAISDHIDAIFSLSKENVIADKTMDYLVWAKKSEFKKASNIYRSFKSEMADMSKVKRITLNRKFIVMGLYKPE
jgi:hypothetical protein